MNPQQAALNVILEEHRTLSAVIDALNHVAQDVAQARLVPDYKLLWSLIYYIDAFPDQQHHPKEDEVLFPRVRARTQAIDTALDELTRQHESGVVHLNRLKTLLGRMEAEVPGAALEFAERIATYTRFHLAHMHQEETVVLGMAGKVLIDEDWQAIADAFGANVDPLCAGGPSQDAWFRQLYRRIVSLVPEPWGVGARRAHPAAG